MEEEHEQEIVQLPRTRKEYWAQRRKHVLKLINEKKLSRIIGRIFLEPLAGYWSVDRFVEHNQPVSNAVLRPDSDEYEHIVDQLWTDRNYKYTIYGIHRIENPYQLGAYLLRLEETKHELDNSNYIERIMYYATSGLKTHFICRRNIPRPVGNHIDHTVYLSYKAEFADTDSNTHVYFVVRVLQHKKHIKKQVDENKRGEHIEWDNAAFYPQYIILFTEN